MMSKKSDKELQILIGVILLIPLLSAIVGTVSAKNENKDEKK